MPLKLMFLVYLLRLMKEEKVGYYGNGLEISTFLFLTSTSACACVTLQKKIFAA